MGHPKNSAPSSFVFALIASLLMATASLSNSQTPQNDSPLAVIGTLTCGLPAEPRPLERPVNVTLSCDGGRTAFVPPVTVSGLGTFAINVTGSAAAKLLDPTKCAMFVAGPVWDAPPSNKEKSSVLRSSRWSTHVSR